MHDIVEGHRSTAHGENIACLWYEKAGKECRMRVRFGRLGHGSGNRFTRSILELTDHLTAKATSTLITRGAGSDEISHDASFLS